MGSCHPNSAGRLLLPFHWPGRNRGFLRGLPPGEVARYRTRLAGWGPTVAAAWLAIGWIVLLGCGRFVPIDDRPFRLLVGLGVPVTVATLLLVSHFQMRRLRWVLEQDYPHLCPTCGYDRRATPDRCPECGTGPGRPPGADPGRADTARL